MNPHTEAPADTAMRLKDVVEAIRNPAISNSLARAMGTEKVHEQLVSTVHDLNSLVADLREAAFAMRVIGFGLSSGLDLAQPEADGVRGLMSGMEKQLQNCCDKINGITGYRDY